MADSRGRKYVRVYYDLEREYGPVFQDDTCLATWLRLLMIAEDRWPNVAEIPRSARTSSVRRLIEAGLVIAVPPYGFRILGLDAERTRRSNAGRNAAGIRWGIADGNAKPMPRHDTPRHDEIPLPPQVGKRKDGTNPRATVTNPRANGHSPRQERAAQKRGGMETLAEIAARAAAYKADA